MDSYFHLFSDCACQNSSLFKFEESGRKKNKAGDRERQNIASVLPGGQEKKIDCVAVGSQYNTMLPNRTQPQELRGAYASHQRSLWLSI